MKKILFFLFIISTIRVSSQECPSPVEVFSLVDTVSSFTYHEGFRYIFIEENNVLSLGKLSTTTNELPHTSPEILIDLPFDNPKSMAFVGDDLYITNDESENYELYKINITDSNPIFTLVSENLGDFSGSSIRTQIISNTNDTNLYISRYTTDEESGFVYTFDTQNPDAGTSLLFEFMDENVGLNFIFSPIILNDTYYFTDTLNGAIYQVNLNDENPEPALFNTTDSYYGFYIGGTGNFLYMTSGSEPNASFYIFDTSSPNAELIYFDVICNDTVASFFIFEDYFYYSSFRRPLEDFVLSVEDPVINNITVFPNPFSNVLFIENLETVSNYQLIDFTGKVVSSGIVKPEENNIRISRLPKGIYFLKIEHQKKYYRVLKK